MNATIELTLQDKTFHTKHNDSLTTGALGNKIHITFLGDTWTDLNKQVIFKVENDRKILPLESDDTIIIPWEVCQPIYLGKIIYIGLRGTKDLNKIQYTENGTTQIGYHYVVDNIVKYYRDAAKTSEITDPAVLETIIILDIDYPTPYYRLGVLEFGSSPNGASAPGSPMRAPYEQAVIDAAHYAQVAKEEVDRIDQQTQNAHDWAVGPSGTGTGTDTNNAKYYSELRATASEEAAAARDAAVIAKTGAEAARDKYPQIIDGTWHYWDPSTSQYIDTEINPTGPQGPIGPIGPTGTQGYYVNQVTKTSGTGAAGTRDTYTMYLNDISHTAAGTFEVYNGADGLSGDMQQSVYDTVDGTHPVQSAGGIPAYVANATSNKITNPSGGTSGQVLSKTNDSYAWADSVTGIKGEQEQGYRTGQVTLTATQIGAQPTINLSGILQGNGSGSISALPLKALDLANYQVLPTPTSAQEGYILKVVNGVWAIVAPEVSE